MHDTEKTNLTPPVNQDEQPGSANRSAASTAGASYIREKANLPGAQNDDPNAAAPTPDPLDEAPDANVGMGDRCIQPSYAESTRIDTGEPCLDGRDGK